MSKNKTRTKDKYRVVYNDTQRIELENEFRLNEYIAIPRKQEIAQKLQLSERQIKIWFQNRRAKKRKQLKRRVTTTTATANNTSPSSNNMTPNATQVGGVSITGVTTPINNNVSSNNTSPTSNCDWPSLMQPLPDHSSSSSTTTQQQHLNLNHVTQEQTSQALIMRQQQAQATPIGVTLNHPQQHPLQQQSQPPQQQPAQHITDPFPHHHHNHHHHRSLNANRYQHLQNQQVSASHEMHQQPHILPRPNISQQQQQQQQSMISNHHIPLTTSPHLPLSHVQPSQSPYNSTSQPGFLNDTNEQLQPTLDQQLHSAGQQIHHNNQQHPQQQHFAAQHQQQHHQSSHNQHMMYCSPQAHHHNQMLQVGLATHHAWRQFHSTPQQHQEIHTHVSPPMQNGTPSPHHVHQQTQQQQQQPRIQSPHIASHLPHQQHQAAAAQMQHQHYWYQHQHHHTNSYVPMGNSPMHEIVETL